MRKQKYSCCKKTNVAFTSKMEADMLFFCRNKGIKSKSELIRKAVSNYIYANNKDKTLNHDVLKQIQDILASCQLSISFNEKI
jgi:metal-responsive CopG/Arc/MetJ family transcriptional regulator